MSRPLRPGLALAALLCFGAAAQAPGDPLDAAECRSALDALKLQEEKAGVTAPSAPRAAASVPAPAAPRPGDAAPRTPSSPSSPLEAARRQAARACLGTRADPPRGRMAQPPLAVPGVPPAAPAAPVAPARPLPVRPGAAAVPRAEPPVVVTGCDEVGCWASDGTRVQRVGPNLLGPRGFCTLQGAVLTCP